MKKGHIGSAAKAVADNAKTIEAWSEAGNNLSALNTMRGGLKGNKGFVAEELQAAEATATGKTTQTLNNNGIADLVYTGKNGHRYLQQMKVGYKPSQINFAKYKGQTIVVDKGNPFFEEMVNRGKAHGVKVIEGNITKEQAQNLSSAMQMETKITGAKTATVVPKVATAHNAGLKAGKSGALYGAGFSLATNAVDVINGDKEVGEAAVDVAKDTAISYGAGYAIGAAGTAIAGTSTGAAAIGAVSSAGVAITGTTVGGAVVGAGTAAAGAVAAAGTAATGAVVGAVGTVGGAIGSAAVAATAGTAVGGAVAAGVGAAAAGAAVVGAAAVAAAPVVAVGAAAGFLYKGIRSLFD